MAAIRAAGAPEGAWRQDGNGILMLCINLFVVRITRASAGDRGDGLFRNLRLSRICSDPASGAVLRGDRTFQSVVDAK